jgi:hypothetical protein
MSTKVGAIRLKLNESAESQLARAMRPADATIGRVRPRLLAAAIASRTVDALVEGEMLDPDSAPDLVRAYETHLDEGRPVHDCILRFLIPDEGKLAMAANWLNGHTRLHVWEMAHRIPPPKAFYKAHPEIVEACKLCGTAVIDAGSPATLTTASINPLAGDFFGNWVQSALEIDPTETRARFFFHVVIPPRHWDAVAQAHFRVEYGV